MFKKNLLVRVEKKYLVTTNTAGIFSGVVQNISFCCHKGRWQNVPTVAGLLKWSGTVVSRWGDLSRHHQTHPSPDKEMRSYKHVVTRIVDMLMRCVPLVCRNVQWQHIIVATGLQNVLLCLRIGLVCFLTVRLLCCRWTTGTAAIMGDARSARPPSDTLSHRLDQQSFSTPHLYSYTLRSLTAIRNIWGGGSCGSW